MTDLTVKTGMRVLPPVRVSGVPIEMVQADADEGRRCIASVGIRRERRTYDPDDVVVIVRRLPAGLSMLRRGFGSIHDFVNGSAQCV
jgi:hypothetical protein